jgi:hypothetical protein
MLSMRRRVWWRWIRIWKDINHRWPPNNSTRLIFISIETNNYDDSKTGVDNLMYILENKEYNSHLHFPDPSKLQSTITENEECMLPR